MTSISQRGFSLLEAMVSIGIAMTMMLMAVVALRSASQTLRGIQNAIDENLALQRGWVEGLQDTDYWLSNAEPGFPYLAGYQSEAVVVNGSTDHPWDKRPFRSVTFRPGTNPNELLPHDPRTWYRGGSMVMTTPVSRPAPGYEPTFVWLYTADPIVALQSNGDFDIPRFPAGWAPWHQIGDHAAMARALATGDGSTEFADEIAADSATTIGTIVPRSVTDAVPSLQWWLFSELGHAGASAYLPPGTPVLINRPTTNRTSANVGNDTKYFDWGEVPFALARGGPAGPDTFAPDGFTQPSSADLGGANRVKGIRRRNMLLGMPGSGAQLTAVQSKNLTFPSGWEQYSSFSNERSGFNTAFACDYEAAASRSSATRGKLNQARMLPTRAFRIGADWDTWSLIDRTVMDPFRLLSDDEANAGNANVSYHVSSTTGSTQHMDERFGMSTQHMPAVASNDDRRPDGYDGMTLSHQIVRYRANFAERVKLGVTVFNPRSDRVIEIGGSAVGTTYVGARQHWGWKSSVRPALGAMGDQYAP